MFFLFFFCFFLFCLFLYIYRWVRCLKKRWTNWTRSCPSTSEYGTSHWTTKLHKISCGNLPPCPCTTHCFPPPVSIQAKEQASRMEHCSWHFYSSFLSQTCFIVFVTYLLYSKTPKQVFFNFINIFDSFTHSVTVL